MTDEPLIVPMTPGSALIRLSQVRGALLREPAIAGALPAVTAAQLDEQRTALLQALEAGDTAAIATGFRAVQQQMAGLYFMLRNTDSWTAEQSAAHCVALGFPDPTQEKIQAIDTSSVLVTFAQPNAQVLTNISFNDAAGATGYWLYEVRYFDGQRVEDAIIGATSSYFSRIRLACGTRFLSIESRNPSSWVRSDEFQIEVPAPE